MSKDEKKELSTENMTRLTPLMIYKILREESSKDHPLTTGDILSRLEEQGLKITRQTMYKDIVLLRNMGFDVVWQRRRANEYYLKQNDFDMSEQRILLDAISAARFIPENKTKDLVYKVACLNGQANSQDLIKSMMHFTNVKYDDPNIYNNINNITKAIEMNRKISFYYFDYNERKQKKYRKNKEMYIENPVGTVCSDNNYYILVYNEKYNKIINYRIDRMDKVAVYSEDRRLPEDVDERTKEYMNSQFSMFAGNTVKVWIDSTKQHINSIMDMFGSDVRFQDAPDNRVRFHAQVQLAPTFYSWVAGFKGDMVIMSPADAINGFCDFLADNLKQYPRYNKNALQSIIQSSETVLYTKTISSLSKTAPGRPRKAREAKPLEADNAEVADIAATAAPARKRGRPRKYPLPDASAVSAPADTSPANPSAPAVPAEPQEPANGPEDT